MKIAVYPGSFDPITMGHLDIIKRAAAMFDHVIVAVLTNSKKSPLFSADERKHMIKESVVGINNVEIDEFDGLLVDYIKKKNAYTIVRGLRAMSDFENEFQMALINKKMNPDAETVFFSTSLDYMYLSSSVVREIARGGGDISTLVPEQAHSMIINYFKKGGQCK